MKKGILLLIAILSLTTVSAKSTHKLINGIETTNRYNNVINFIEKNIQFHVFLNGDFDFDTHYQNTRYVNYNDRHIQINNGVPIKRDRKGRVKRVGNTFINYNVEGNVSRIGRVYINYHFGKLTSVGNLNIRYDRWDTPQFYGSVKYNNPNYCGTGSYHNNHYDNYANHRNNHPLNGNLNINIGAIFNYDYVYFYQRNFKNNYRKYKEDSNYFYYRAVPNAKIGKRSTILKRRKNKNYSKKSHPKRTIHKYKKDRKYRKYKRDN